MYKYMVTLMITSALMVSAADEATQTSHIFDIKEAFTLTIPCHKCHGHEIVEEKPYNEVFYIIDETTTPCFIYLELLRSEIHGLSARGTLLLDYKNVSNDHNPILSRVRKPGCTIKFVKTVPSESITCSAFKIETLDNLGYDYKNKTIHMLHFKSVTEYDNWYSPGCKIEQKLFEGAIFNGLKIQITEQTTYRELQDKLRTTYAGKGVLMLNRVPIAILAKDYNWDNKSIYNNLGYSLPRCGFLFLEDGEQYSSKYNIEI